MRSRMPAIAAAIILVLFAVPSAHAIVGIGARVSYVHNQHFHDNSIMVGLMGRLRMGLIGFEAAVESRSDDLDNDVKLKTRPITVSVMVHPVPILYALAGLGLYRASIEFPSESSFFDQTDNAFGFHYGVGVEWPFVPLVKLIGDLRYHFVGYEFDDIPAAIGKVDADALSVSAGLLFSL